MHTRPKYKQMTEQPCATVVKLFFVAASIDCSACAAVRLTIDLLSWILARRLRLPWETFTPILVVCAFYFFALWARIGRTVDRQTDGRARTVLRPIRSAAQ